MDHLAPKQFHQTIDRLRIAGAQVVNLVHTLGPRRQVKGPRHIGDIHEITALSAITDDRERFAGQLLCQENTEDRAVSPRSLGPRPKGVENADRVDRKSVHPAPVQDRFFAHVLAQRIGILGSDRRRFLRGHFGHAITGRGRGIDEFADAGVPRGFEDLDRAQHVGGEIVHRSIDRGNDVADAGKVKHVLRSLEQGLFGLQLPDVPDFNLQIRVFFAVLQVLQPPSDQIVNHVNSISLVQ